MATGVGDSSTSILKVLAALPKLSTAADVGSGNGRISNHLRKLGWNVSGCEINPELALLAEVDHADARRWQPPPHCRSSDLHRVDRTPSTRRPTAPVASASILAPNRWHSRPLQPAAPFTRRVLGQIGGASQGHGIRLVGSDTHLSTSAPPPRSAAHRGWLRHPESVRRLLRTRCVRCQIKDLSPSAARLHNRDDGPVRLEPHLHLPSGVVVEVSID